MTLEEWTRQLDAVRDLPAEALRSSVLRGTGFLRDEETAFDYRIGFVAPDAIDGVLDLNQRVCARMPNAPLLYARDAEFFERCAGPDGCLVATWVEGRVVAYAAARFPSPQDDTYGVALGLAAGQVPHVTHLVGSAVERHYRGNRLQTRLTMLRAAYCAVRERWHLCGVVDARNVLSLENHLQVGFLVKGHHVDEFDLANFLVHRDMRGTPDRDDGEEHVCALDDISGCRVQTDAGRWGFALTRRDGVPYLRFASFSVPEPLQ